MEQEFITWLRGRLKTQPAARLGLEDDAAILSLGERRDCVVTTDLLTDGVDFIVGRDDLRRIGRKALAVNLSDLAAMAATPVAAVVSLALPRDGALALAKELYEGILPLADEFGVAIAGGDTNTWDGGLVISVTAIGEVGSQPLLRSGARPGDVVLVTGTLGGSILGKHFDFQPRVNEALALAGRYDLHGGMDISDGLSLDLARMATASGCGAVIELAGVPIDPAAVELARQLDDGSTPLDHALADGEDFELLLAAPPDVARLMLAEQPLDIPLAAVGRFVDTDGLWQQDEQGRRETLVPRGFQH